MPTWEAKRLTVRFMRFESGDCIIAYTMSSPVPSNLFTLPCLFFLNPNPMMNSDMVRTVITSISRLRTKPSMVKGLIAPATPTTAVELNRFEPMTLPMAISCSPFLAARIDEANSGSDVPTATMVKPMTKSLTPKSCAISTAPQTRIRELKMRKSKPNTRKSKAFFRDTGCGTAWSTSSAKASGSFFNPLKKVQTIRSANNKSKTAASNKENSKSRSNPTESKVTNVRIGSSLRRMFELTCTGLSKAVKPNMSAIFAIFDPYALPMAIPELPCIAARTDTEVQVHLCQSRQ